jgi:hypothetical protein
LSKVGFAWLHTHDPQNEKVVWDQASQQKNWEIYSEVMCTELMPKTKISLDKMKKSYMEYSTLVSKQLLLSAQIRHSFVNSLLSTFLELAVPYEMFWFLFFTWYLHASRAAFLISL